MGTYNRKQRVSRYRGIHILVQDTIKKILSLTWSEDVGMSIAKLIITVSRSVKNFGQFIIDLTIALILDIYDSLTK